MTAELVVFCLLGAVSLGSALLVVLLRNTVHAALMLVVNFATIAAFYAVLEAQFLATIQIIVYAGAIMVLFLFVMMLLGVARDDDPRAADRIRGQKPAAILLGVVLFAALAFGVAAPYLTPDSACPQGTAATAEQPAAAGRSLPCVGLAAANEPGNVQAIGALLFGPYVWPFEVTSILLVIAAIGAMVLGRKTERPEDLVDRVETEPLGGGEDAVEEPEPAGEPVGAYRAEEA